MYFGNIYQFLTEDEIKNALLRQVNTYNLLFLLPVFEEAWESKFWRDKGYDGATFITDKTHPSIDVFLHDWGYRVYGGNYMDDFIFYKLQLILKDKAKRNYLGVRIGGFVLRVRNRVFKGKKGDSTENTVQLYNFLRKI
jgi:hypothetical protein